MNTFKNIAIALVAISSLSLTGCASDGAQFDVVEYSTNKFSDIKSDLNDLNKKDQKVDWSVQDKVSATFGSDRAKAIEALAFIINDDAFADKGPRANLVIKACRASKEDALSFDKLERLEKADHDLFVGCWIAIMNYPKHEDDLRQGGSERQAMINVGSQLKGIHKEFNISEEDGIKYPYL